MLISPVGELTTFPKILNWICRATLRWGKRWEKGMKEEENERKELGGRD